MKKTICTNCFNYINKGRIINHIMTCDKCSSTLSPVYINVSKDNVFFSNDLIIVKILDDNFTANKKKVTLLKCPEIKIKSDWCICINYKLITLIENETNKLIYQCNTTEKCKTEIIPAISIYNTSTKDIKIQQVILNIFAVSKYDTALITDCF